MIGRTAPLKARIAELERELAIARGDAHVQAGLADMLRDKLLESSGPKAIECAVCAAKDQTIVLLSDVVDWHRMQPTATAPQPAFPPLAAVEPRRDLFVPDDVEDLMAAMESGALSEEAGERALAQIQALGPIEIAR